MQGKNIRSRAAAHATRLSVIILVGLVAASITVGTTYAYFCATTNTAKNSISTGEVAVALYENGQLVEGSALDATLGEDAKQVKIANPAGSNNASEVVRITFVPEVQALGGDSGTEPLDANAFVDQTWPVSASEFTATEDGKYSTATIGETTLYFAPDWQSSWTYDNGTFYYKGELAPGSETPVLLMGATWADGAEQSGYGEMRVNVIAEGLQANAKAQWGMS